MALEASMHAPNMFTEYQVPSHTVRVNKSFFTENLINHYNYCYLFSRITIRLDAGQAVN